MRMGKEEDMVLVDGGGDGGGGERSEALREVGGIRTEITLTLVARVELLECIHLPVDGHEPILQLLHKILPSGELQKFGFRAHPPFRHLWISER